MSAEGPSPGTAGTRSSAVTLFSWGYAGWGSSISQLLAVTEAAERARGFEPPVFVDARFSRSVRAPGFRERAFETALPSGRYRWMKGLGNEAIASGGGMKIHVPDAAADLLDLALEESGRSRRVLFFCSCESPELCHRSVVRGLLLRRAAKRALPVSVAEWPGGEPADAPVCTLETSPALFTRILRGAPRIPVDETLALGVLASHPWGGTVELSDGERSTVAAVGPARYSAGGWFVAPFVPVEEGAAVDALAKAVRSARARRDVRVFRAT